MGWRFGGAVLLGLRRVGGFAMVAKSEEDAGVDGSLEVSLEELQEFLDGDHCGARPSPEFKESLRERLWHFVLQQSRRWRGGDPT